MGQNHFRTYAEVPGAQLVAVADKVPERVASEAASLSGNLGGDPHPLDLCHLSRYTSLDEVLADESVDCVDLCTPTHLHAEMTVRALEAGKHVICEKPMALNVAEGERMIAAAEASDRLLFIAQCIRFWPAYEVLAEMIAAGDLGRLVSAKFTRLSSAPTWAESGWLLDTDLSGGALLDLHIHDVDFLLSVLGAPPAVLARAGNRISSGEPVDHVITTYLYEDLVCVAEGGWGFPAGFPFYMGFQVLGEQGCLDFGLSNDPPLAFYRADGERVIPDYPAGDGYGRELNYFMECLEKGEQPTRVTAQGALEAVGVVAAERESVRTGQIVAL
jgi:predicted dehydrogenase